MRDESPAGGAFCGVIGFVVYIFVNLKRFGPFKCSPNKSVTPLPDGAGAPAAPPSHWPGMAPEHTWTPGITLPRRIPVAMRPQRRPSHGVAGRPRLANDNFKVGGPDLSGPGV